MIKDISGQRFNRLVVLRYVGINSNSKAIWECLCDCGEVKNITSNNLISGNTVSCGCYHKQISTVHSHLGSPEYRIWANMKSRCYNHRHNRFKYYGGRGITVCEEWKNSFASFLSDMGYRPSAAHSIDRIDVNGNYNKANCKWSTMTEQNKNRRKFKRNTCVG